MSFWFGDEHGREAKPRGKQMRQPLPSHFNSEAEARQYHPPVLNMCSTIRGKKSGGSNVMRKARNDTIVADNQAHIRRMNQQTVLSQWHEARDQQADAVLAKKQGMLLKSELELANKEVKALRRERLRHLLHAEHEQYLQILSDAGLAVISDEH